MIDNTVAATDYQWQRRCRALAKSFVVMVEGIGFEEGSLGAHTE